MTKVFIDGAAGTTGLKIHTLLSARPELTLLTIDPDRRKDPSARADMLNAADFAVLCLPDDAAREAVSLIENPSVRVLDASTAHRTALGWAYGLPELSPAHRAAVETSARIAVPGCHATGFLAIVYPLVSAGILSPDTPVACHSITGYSGGGKSMIAQYEDPARDSALDSPRQYALGLAHKHLPEMTHVSGLQAPPVFNPIVCDFYAGMAVSVPLHTAQLRQPSTRDALETVFRRHYASARFVSVHEAPQDGFLPANLVCGTNELRLFILGRDEQVTIVAVLDNLGKGAGGAAMQCLNIALGLPEDAGF